MVGSLPKDRAGCRPGSCGRAGTMPATVGQGRGELGGQRIGQRLAPAPRSSSVGQVTASSASHSARRLATIFDRSRPESARGRTSRSSAHPATDASCAAGSAAAGVVTCGIERHRAVDELVDRSSSEGAGDKVENPIRLLRRARSGAEDYARQAPRQPAPSARRACRRSFGVRQPTMPPIEWPTRQKRRGRDARPGRAGRR